jgi:hypothetical protein
MIDAPVAQQRSEEAIASSRRCYTHVTYTGVTQEGGAGGGGLGRVLCYCPNPFENAENFESLD